MAANSAPPTVVAEPIPSTPLCKVGTFKGPKQGPLMVNERIGESQGIRATSFKL